MSESSGEPVATLAERPLSELREQYRYDLFEDFLPFLDKHVIDHRYGGFMCNTDRSGNNITTEKNAVYEGRGLWVYSFLHNNLAKEGRYLDVAHRSAAFVLAHLPEDGGFWPGSFTREGRPTDARRRDIYGGLFIANGLAEYSNVAGARYWDIAKAILVSHLALYDAPDYAYPVTSGLDIPAFAGVRVLGHWMVMLRLATQMLQTASDPAIAAIADRCVSAILDHHLNPELGLMNEVLHHDLSRPTNGMEQFSDVGHAIEALWMVMFEAVRRKDEVLLARAAELFRRHVEVAWDDDCGGLFRSLQHVGSRTWNTDKFLWVHEEALIGSLFMLEHTADAWARDWFDRVYRFVRRKFPLRPHGYALWMFAGDRQVTFEEEATRVENFHHPRHLMLNLLCLNRLIARGV